MDETAVAVLGAGPHGLAAAAALRRAGVEVRVFGDPMSFWRTMPAGMVLRSNWTATCIAEYDGPLSLDSYLAETGAEVPRPVPLDDFVAYGTWVQAKVAPDVDRRWIDRVTASDDGFVLELADESRIRARRLVVAAGIADFVNRPDVAAGLPGQLTSHTADHDDLATFAGQEVLVVGGGQSALESAALLHENGAEVDVVARADNLNWLHGGVWQRRLGRLKPLFYAPTDVGPLGISRIVAAPGLFTSLPRAVQEPMAHRAIRPAGAAWLIPRLVEVPIRVGVSVTKATRKGSRVEVELSDGDRREVDHLMFGTGYRVDISRYPFLPPALAARIRSVDGYPVLGRGMESSVPGLHFLGAPAARSFGPLMRFVAGGWYGAESLTRAVRGRPGRAAHSHAGRLEAMGGGR
ncbi:NAD(P)-binding domain-containing protein [Kribbella sp. NBC_00382]|uniref:FAD-dependent oxidoreductase n=1 Tax=Kribbella sp. NBC_00382 TaxID=2975967 RepID=UPI002E2432C9